MNTWTPKTITLQLVLAAATVVAAGPARAHGGAPQGDINLRAILAEARKATAPFNDLDAALAANYVKFPDLAGDCVAQPGQGAMGIHYLNASLVDTQLDPLRPELLVYGKTAGGKDKLVALEYVVPAPAWDALHPQPPVLFGHPFHLLRTPNRYGLTAPLYTLHVWLWEHNPDGLFNDWNPLVTCS